MKKILFLSPRLDCSFKKGHVPDIEGPPNHPVRLYWVEFEKRMLEFCYKHGHSFEVLKKLYGNLHQKMSKILSVI